MQEHAGGGGAGVEIIAVIGVDIFYTVIRCVEITRAGTTGRGRLAP